MVSLNVGLEVLPILFAGHAPEGDWTDGIKCLAHLGVIRRCLENRYPANRSSGLPLRGKRDNAKRLQLLQHVQARVDLELTCGVLPVEVLANSKRQLLATQILEFLYGLLNLAQLLSGESSAAEGGAGQCLNGRHHYSTLLNDE